MRVSQNVMLRNFNRSLSRNVNSLAQSNNRIVSKRKFSRMSENVADGAKALKVREQLYKNEQYLTNIRDAEGELSAAESSLYKINDLMKTVKERILQGMNGDKADSREIYAKEIDNIKAQVMQLANTQYAGKYLFAGSNNDAPPFQISDTGNVTYNGFDVNTNDPTNFPKNEAIFIDIGLGIVVKGDEIDRNSALQINVLGNQMLGSGTTETGMPNNVVSFLDKVSADLRDPNFDIKNLDNDLDQLDNIASSLLINLTDIGDKAQFLSYNVDRIETDQINLKTSQSALEETNLEQEATYNKVCESAWMITLQMGSKILPPSLFDFLR